jgi:hypothetical protein
VILLLAIAAGFFAGLLWAARNQVAYEPPVLRHVWLVFVAFLPQYIMIYLPLGDVVSQSLFATLLMISQLLFLGFLVSNRNLSGMKVLALGALLNFLVMGANHGFMPIGPQTVERLIPEGPAFHMNSGDRFGAKDIFLLPEQTHFEWLADRFLTPAWFPYQSAFSLGDVFIAAGAFWLLAKQRNKRVITYDRSNYVSTVRQS